MTVRGRMLHWIRHVPAISFAIILISVVTARLMVDLWVRVQWAMYCALQA